MKIKHFWSALLIAALTASTSAQEKTVAVKAGRIIDGTGRPATGAIVIVIEDDRIKTVGPALAVPAGAPRRSTSVHLQSCPVLSTRTRT